MVTKYGMNASLLTDLWGCTIFSDNIAEHLQFVASMINEFTNRPNRVIVIGVTENEKQVEYEVSIHKLKLVLSDAILNSHKPVTDYLDGKIIFRVTRKVWNNGKQTWDMESALIELIMLVKELGD